MSGRPPRPAPSGHTHFGFRTVAESAKPALVRGVFDSVATRYDLMNDLMSLGVHRLWKAVLLDALNPRPGMRLVDVAGGTGDVSLGFLARGGGAAVIVDLTPAMLAVGRARAGERGLGAGLGFVCGDAEALPLADMTADAYTIAFGLRNVTRIARALAEARRVLKPGGRFLCLEFSRVVLPALAGLYERYSFAVLPRLGRWVASDEGAYTYLAESIRRFPPQEELAALIAGAGLERVGYRNLSGGIAALHSAWRL
ncbi:MAG: class I SAM-dependent methyltransferase [Proteobacteria bacterium]|nr:class I SAM-dependent methyltransferase [Pseudomonadota bacterium]